MSDEHESLDCFIFDSRYDHQRDEQNFFIQIITEMEKKNARTITVSLTNTFIRSNPNLCVLRVFLAVDMLRCRSHQVNALHVIINSN